MKKVPNSLNFSSWVPCAMQEVKHLQALDHPHVARVYQHFEDAQARFNRRGTGDPYVGGAFSEFFLKVSDRVYQRTIFLVVSSRS